MLSTDLGILIMNFLRDHDIENLKLRAGYGTGDVTLTRDEFETLIEGYHRTYVSRDDLALTAKSYALGARVRDLQDQVIELTAKLELRGLLSD